MGKASKAAQAEQQASETNTDAAAAADAAQGAADTAAPSDSGEGGEGSSGAPEGENRDDTSQLDPGVIEAAGDAGFAVDGQTTEEAAASAEFAAGFQAPAAEPGSPPAVLYAEPEGGEPRDDDVAAVAEWDQRPGDLDISAEVTSSDHMQGQVGMGWPVAYQEKGRLFNGAAETPAIVTSRRPDGTLNLIVLPDAGVPYPKTGVPCVRGKVCDREAADHETGWRFLPVD